MNNLPIEKQVCTLEQAQELAELLGHDAPESLLVWIDDYKGGGWKAVSRETPSPGLHTQSYAAYTGDELGSLLPSPIAYQDCVYYYKSQKLDGGVWSSEYERPSGDVLNALQRNAISISNFNAQAKAALAIQGLKEGWIKKEEFKYAV